MIYSRPTTLPETRGKDIQTLRALAPFLWTYRGRVLLALGFLVLAKVANVGIPLVLKDIVDRLDTGTNATLVLPLALLVMYGLLKLASSLFTELRDSIFARVRHGAMRSVSLKVLEHLPQDVPNEPVPPEDVDKIEWFTRRALEELQQYAESSGIPADRANVVVTADSPEQEIIRFIESNDVDLVVVGAHERHGLALFQGRTADNLIHNAPCDVLVVHL